MTSEQIGNALAPVNALLNTSSTVLLIVGFIAIRRKKIPVHRASMVGAFVASCVFLVGYLTRFALTGSHRFPDLGWIRVLYLAILLSHMVLAVVTVPLVLRTLFLAHKKRFDEHRKIAASRTRSGSTSRSPGWSSTGCSTTWPLRSTQAERPRKALA